MILVNPEPVEEFGMRLRRALIGALVALIATIGLVGVAAPVSAAPAICSAAGYNGGRNVIVDNLSNGDGAYVYADVCYQSLGNGYFDTAVFWTVTDTLANDAGATIRMEWTGTNGDTGYDVPPTSQRAYGEWNSAEGDWGRDDIKDLYVRACLTNTGSEAHHCGPKG
jgi:hypothetical protein